MTSIRLSLNPIVKLLAAVVLLLPVASAVAAPCPDLLDVDVRRLNDNRVVNLCREFRDKVLLVVNTASKCGYTGQYAELESLYESYRDEGLVVLGFPSNDFGGQEPGSEHEIQQFCVNTYAVRFPMFQKTRVKRHHADPLYRKLGSQAGFPQWNFHKYLIARDGTLATSYPSPVSPTSDQVVSSIRRLLRE